MDALRGERGQALVVAALLLGLAALSLSALHAAAALLLEDVRDQRAGEAAVAAAGAAVADLEVARSRELGRDLGRGDTAAFAADTAVLEAARVAAVRLARLHGRADPSAVTVTSYGFEVEVVVTLGRHTHIALLQAHP